MGAISNFIKSAATILPETAKPVRKPSLNEKFIWTAVALVIYFIMSQIPLYGVPSGLADQLAYTRIIFASSRGTLMELGIGPIVTAGIILQLLKGAELIKLDLKKPEDRGLFMSATKLLTVIVALGEAAAYITGGLFGTNLAATTAIIILIQLFVAVMVVMLLDELIQKGWGLGSGISLFILAGVAQTIMWDAFSLLPSGKGPLGVIPHLVNSTLAGVPQTSFMREGSLPSVLTLIFTIIVFLIIIYAEGVKIEIPITSTKYRGFSGVYPIKLLYVSVLPVIMVSALTAVLNFISQFVWSRFNQANSNIFLNWIATYDPNNLAKGATGGLLYYTTPQSGLQAALANPVHTVFYISFFVILSIIFAVIWVDIAGLSPKAAAESLIDANVQVPGFRRTTYSIESILSKYIPVLTIISGAAVGLLASGANTLGVFGSGTGILLAVGIAENYYQILMKEQLESMMPRLAGFLGQ